MASSGKRERDRDSLGVALVLKGRETENSVQVRIRIVKFAVGGEFGEIFGQETSRRFSHKTGHRCTHVRPLPSMERTPSMDGDSRIVEKKQKTQFTQNSSPRGFAM
jgi:hypothetical protein